MYEGEAGATRRAGEETRARVRDIADTHLRSRAVISSTHITRPREQMLTSVEPEAAAASVPGRCFSALALGESGRTNVCALETFRKSAPRALTTPERSTSSSGRDPSQPARHVARFYHEQLQRSGPLRDTFTRVINYFLLTLTRKVRLRK